VPAGLGASEEAALEPGRGRADATRCAFSAALRSARFLRLGEGRREAAA